MRQMKTLLAIPVLFGAIEASAAPDSDRGLLEEVVVTATRSTTLLHESPSAISVIDAEDLRDSIANQLADSLQKLPGIHITDAGQAGQKRIRIRGEESRRVALLIDGQEFMDHREVGVPLLADINRVQRIEVVRGPASVLYGPKAMGGVINVITRSDPITDTRFNVSSSYDTATSGHTAFARVQGGSDQLQFDLSGSINDQGNRDTPEGTIDNTAYESSSLNGAVSYVAGNHNIHLAYDNFESDSEVFVEDEVRFSPPFRDFIIDAPRRDREKVRLDYQYSPSQSFLTSVKMDAYHQVSDREFNTFPLMTLGPGVNMDISIFTTSQLVSDGFNAQFDMNLHDNVALIGGLQWMQDEVDQDRLRTVEINGFETERVTQVDKASLDTAALYVQGEIDLSDSWILYAGLRGYQVDGELDYSNHGPIGTEFDDNHVVSSLAAVYTNGPHALRLNYSEGYIYPSLFNLVVGAFAGSSFINPVTDLKPETSETVEIGYRYAGVDFSVDATLFSTHADDYIDHLPCLATDMCPGSRDRIYKNTGKADSHGVELALNLELDWMMLEAGVTWLKRKKQYEGVESWDAGVPEWTGYVAISRETSIRSRALTTRLIGRFESETDELVATRRGSRLDHNSGYGVFDLSASYSPTDQIDLSMVAGNIFDRKYHSATENLWAPGRHLKFRMSLAI